MPFYLVYIQVKLSFLLKKIHQKISLPDVKIPRKRLLSPMRSQNVPVKRAAFHISRKGSLTAEAAFVLPLFLFCTVTLTGLMEIYGTYAQTVVGLQEEAEKAGMYAAALGEKENLVSERSGWAEYKPFWLPFQSAAVRVGCRARVRAWTGSSGRKDDGEGLTGKGERLVFVTEHGRVYHTTSRCSHLALAVRQVESTSVKDMRNSGGGRYYPCEKCVGSGETYPYLYVTEQGDRYHNSLECSGLKRTVRLEELSSLAGMGCCSRCIQLEGG